MYSFKKWLSASVLHWPTGGPCEPTVYVLRQYLRAIAEALRPCGRAAAFYLAAAVSDFFIPWKDMVSLTG